MRFLSETGLTGHSQKLLLGAGPLTCTGVSQSKLVPFGNMVVRNIGFATQQTWVQSFVAP